MTGGRPVVLFGTGPIAKLVRYLLEHDSPIEVVAVTVDRDHMQDSTAFGLPVVPFEAVPERFPPSDYDMFIAMGYRGINRLREDRYHLARALGYRLISYVSSRASTWPDLVLGDNCLVMDRVMILPFARIGSDVFLWSGSHIGHEATVRDHAYVASNAVVSGFVTVGERAFLGSNSTIRDGVTVAPETVVGAGAMIRADTQERQVYASPPGILLPGGSDRLPSL